MLVVERRMVSKICLNPPSVLYFEACYSQEVRGYAGWLSESYAEIFHQQKLHPFSSALFFLQVSFSLIQWKRHLVQMWFGLFAWCGLNIVNPTINNENECWQKKRFYVSTSLNFSCRACPAYKWRATQAVITFQQVKASLMFCFKKSFWALVCISIG